MNRLRTLRYCRDCGGEVARANNPMAESAGLGMLVGGAELPLWVGVGVGVLLASVLGSALGIISGIVVAVGIGCVWLTGIVRLNRKHAIYACLNCGHRFSFAETSLRKQPHGTNPS